MSPSKPLTLKAPEVRELIATGKCEVRRPIKPGPTQTWITREQINSTVAKFEHCDGEWWRMAAAGYERSVVAGVEIDGGHIGSVKCPLPVVGSEVWIREAYAIHSQPQEGQGIGYWIEYQANHAKGKFKWDGLVRPDFSSWWAKAADDGWLPSKSMPQEASRLTATVTSLAAEQRDGWEWVATIEKTK